MDDAQDGSIIDSAVPYDLSLIAAPQPEEPARSSRDLSATTASVLTPS